MVMTNQWDRRNVSMEKILYDSDVGEV